MLDGLGTEGGTQLGQRELSPLLPGPRRYARCFSTSLERVFVSFDV